LKNTFELDDAWTFIRTPAELKTILKNVPFSSEEVERKGNSIYMILLSAEPDALTGSRLKIKRNDVDELVPAGREVYWLRRSSKGEHVAPPPISEILDAPATVRSLHAIRQILDHIEHPKIEKPKLVKLEDATRSERSRQ
jgi:uncharacterized protein (DUF1697 family)